MTNKDRAALREAASKFAEISARANSLRDAPAWVDAAGEFRALAHPAAVLALLDECERMREALIALADAADAVGEKLHIVQPYLALYKKHGDTIAAARAALGDGA